MQRMTRHMLGNLKRVYDGEGCGFHYGTIHALVKRGLIEEYRSWDCYGHFGLNYRVTPAGQNEIESRGLVEHGILPTEAA